MAERWEVREKGAETVQYNTRAQAWRQYWVLRMSEPGADLRVVHVRPAQSKEALVREALERVTVLISKDVQDRPLRGALCELESWLRSKLGDK
jgi:hypothetical protein